MPVAAAELRHALQRRPGLAVGGVLDRDGLGAEAEECLDQLVGVPHPHLVQLVGFVELVLDPVRRGAAAHPHVRRLGGVLVQVVESGAVDRLLRPHVRSGAGGRGRDGRDRIAVGLGREAPASRL